MDEVNSSNFVEFGTPNLRERIRNLATNCFLPCSNLVTFWQTIVGFLPIVSWAPKYSWKDDLLADAIAGITTGVMHIPQGIAYAILSGVHPINGLYSSFLSPLIYMFFGTSKHVSVGSFAVVALMSGVTNEEIMEKFYGQNGRNISLPLVETPSTQVDPVTIASTLTFTLGIIQLAAAILKLDFLSTYFCDSLVGGFTTGAAVHVLFSQLDDILGIKLRRVSGPGYLFLVAKQLIMRISEANYTTLLVSLFAGTFLVVTKDYLTPVLNKLTKKFKVTLPYELFVMIVVTILSYIFEWHKRQNVRIVGEIPTGFPTPRLPNWAIIPYCVDNALAIAVVNLAVHISMAKLLAKKMGYKIDPAQELYAVGFVSTISGFFPTYPTSTALGRTMVNVESGARTQFSAFFTCLLLFSVIMFLGPFFQTLPLCILSTVIVVALRPMFKKFANLPKIWRISKHDFFIWILSFCATVFINVIGGLVIAIVVALFSVIFRTQWPTWHAEYPSDEHAKKLQFGYCIFRFESFLLFTNVEQFRCNLHETMARWTASKKRPNIFIFDCSAITQIDCQGISTFKDCVSEIETFKDPIVSKIFLMGVRENVKKALLDANVTTENMCTFRNKEEILKSQTLNN